MANKNPISRTRNYATVVYPESAPADWQDILASMCIPAFISPLHDKDINPDGETKKPHYHVLIMFDSVKTLQQAIDVFEKIGGVGHEIVQSTRGYSRYLCHLDNPEKAQYSPEDVRMMGGADYLAVIGLASDRYASIGEMLDFIENNDIYSYWELLTWSRLNRPDWFRTLCDNGTFVIREAIKSRSYILRKGE